MDNSDIDSAATPDAGAKAPPSGPPAPPADSDAADSLDTESAGTSTAGSADGTEQIDDPTVRAAARKRRRGSRGGRNRKKPGLDGATADGSDDEFDDDEDFDDEGEGTLADDDAREPSATSSAVKANARRRPGAAAAGAVAADEPELPERMSENRPSVDAAEKALVRKPQIGDTRPAPVGSAGAPTTVVPGTANAKSAGRAKGVAAGKRTAVSVPADADGPDALFDARLNGGQESESAKKKRRRGGKGRGTGTGTGGRSEQPVPELDADVLERRRGRERNGRPLGRYLMCVQVRPTLTQVAVLEGRTLIEHYVSRPADDVSQIHGNIYVGKVQNVLPGMEAAFVDIGTPKNAVLYRGDVQYDAEDIVQKQD